MPIAKNIPIGTRFGRWTVIGPAVSLKQGINKRRNLPCRCDCGTEKLVQQGNLLITGPSASRSCGCFRDEKFGTLRRTHRGSGTRLHNIWKGIKYRCYQPNCHAYADYGGRGIGVCDEWLKDFAAFREWAERFGYADDLSIDRIDNDLGYFPANCRWVTRVVQNYNSRHNRLISAFGEEKFLTDWIQDNRCSVSIGSVHRRLKAGWSPERAIAEPPHQ